MIPPFCVPWWEENGYTPTDVLYLLQKLAGTGDPDAIELSGIIDLSDRSLEMWIRRSY